MAEPSKLIMAHNTRSPPTRGLENLNAQPAHPKLQALQVGGLEWPSCNHQKVKKQGAKGPLWAATSAHLAAAEFAAARRGSIQNDLGRYRSPATVRIILVDSVRKRDSNNTVL